MDTSDKKQKIGGSVNNFILQIRNLQEKAGESLFLYRGLSDVDWEVEAAAYRRINRNSEIFQDYIKDLLTEAKKRAFSFGHRQNKELNDLELLAELQHNGAATCLIDFTANPLIALWFACRKHPEKEGEDVKVIALPTGNIDKFKIVTPDDLTKKNIDYFLKGDTLWKWQPWDINNRIIAQQSTFLLGKPTIKEKYYDCLVIKGADKKYLIEELERLFSISETTLFRDLPGFSLANAYDKEYIPPDYFAQGLNKHQSGNFEEAIADYDKAIALEQNKIFAYCNRGIAKHASKNYTAAEAIADYDQAIALDENFAAAHHYRGLANNALGNYEEAIADYDEAIRLGLDNATVYYNRGLAKYSLGNTEEAIADFAETIRLDPNNAIAYGNRGLAKHDLGNTEEAIKDYNQAIKLDPNNAVVYYNRGLAKRTLGNLEGTIEDYDTAIVLKPDYASAYNNRGLVKDILGNHEGAIEDCDKAIALDPNDANAYYNRGNAKLALGNYKEAIANYNEAIRLGLDNAVVYYNRGLAKHALGNHEEAIKDYNEALKQDKDFAAAYHYRGLANNALGNTEEAEKDFATAKKLENKKTD